LDLSLTLNFCNAYVRSDYGCPWTYTLRTRKANERGRLASHCALKALALTKGYNAMLRPEVNKLYKYRAFSARALRMLANNELYFAASNAFNDPFDCRARKGFKFKDTNELMLKMAPLEVTHQKITMAEAVTYLKVVTAKPEAIEEYKRRKSDLFQLLVLQSFGICSFSEISHDILMWSHYSDGHKGFCVEFNRTDENILGSARPVDYPTDDEFPFIDYWKVKPEEKIEEFSKIVLTKSKHWCYEKEWRILDRPNHVDATYSGHTSSYPDSMLSGIIFGARMSREDRRTVIDILSKKPVAFYEAETVKDRFEIKVTEIK
jgi:hypothetical protein